MNTPSPFAEVQRLQDEQREGWVESSKSLSTTPRTHAFAAPVRGLGTGYYQALDFARDLERELAEKDAKIAEQAAQIAALRGALASNRENTCELMGERHWWKDEPRCGYAEQYKAMQKDVADADVALSTPAPPVVPLEDVIPLLDALKIIAANPGASHGPSCLYDSGPISTGAIAKFNAKHLQP